MTATPLRRRHNRKIVLLLVMFVSVVAAACAHVSLRIGVVGLQYRIAELTTQRRVLEERKRRLRLELSLLRDPARVEKIAGGVLGMRRPDPGQIRVVRSRAEINATKEDQPPGGWFRTVAFVSARLLRPAQGALAWRR